jgi:hypothetical protein
VPQAGLGRSRFVYGGGKDLFRWTDGRFAFSREHADWDLLRKRGRIKGTMKMPRPTGPDSYGAASGRKPYAVPHSQIHPLLGSTIQ